MWPLARVLALLFPLLVTSLAFSEEWQCPGLSARPAAECSCDMPHTLRCAGDHTALQIIGRHLREQRARNKNSTISLLDCALRGVSSLSAVSILELAGVGLHGLVVSSGEIRRIQQGAFTSISNTLFALGLPNNQLPTVPTEALAHLPKLDRLDLSNNKILKLEDNTFRSIQNLTFLDLSDNQLTEISSIAFRPLNKLTVLRLRGNLLKVAALPPLKEARLLKELDLSSNALEGPLSPSTVPSLRCLQYLFLADNTFASIRRGALSGLTNLTHLNLHHNQIDVLEDDAFKHLVNLTHLDLSHNDIVSVSGGSLAQLTNLIQLDLSQNFLRSLSAEPLKSLNQLSDLLLHDNDISMIDDGALSDHKNLRRFTIEGNINGMTEQLGYPYIVRFDIFVEKVEMFFWTATDLTSFPYVKSFVHKVIKNSLDNPLNCDCLMAGFARWLREAKNLSQSDKSAAICATPPHLEGALLSRLSKNKLCDDDHLLESHRINIPILTKEIEEVSYVSVSDSVIENSAIIEEKSNSGTIENVGQFNYEDDSKLDGLDDDIYDEEFDVPTKYDLPISKSQVRLQEASYADEEIFLSWEVLPLTSKRYRCTEVSISREGGSVKLVACHRSPPSHIWIKGLKVNPLEKYKICIALEEMDNRDVPVALVQGCAPFQNIHIRASYVPPAITTSPPPVIIENEIRVSEVRSNVTTDGLLTVLVSLMGFSSINLYSLPRTQRLSSSEPRYLPNCYVILEVLSRGSLVAQKDTRCQNKLEISMDGFFMGPYEVCATISKFKNGHVRSICVVPQLIDNVNSMQIKSGFKNLNTALVGVSLGLMVLVIGLVWFVRKMLKKPTEFETHRCFRQEPVVEETPRANYVMLTATSKV